MKAVIYARFSSDRQTEDSITAQVRACREYAEAHNIEILSVYADEAISGKESKTALREQYQQMLKDAQKGLFEAILIHKYDRVARSLNEHVLLENRLKKANIELIAVAQNFGSTNESKIMRTLMWSLSEYYIDNLASEVKKGHRETALKALHNGGYAPFGYDVQEQKYIINELEAGYVQKMFDCAESGSGFKALISEMNDSGITGKRGKPISYNSIYDILRNEKYTGVYLYTPQEETNRENRRLKANAIRIEGAIPAIITKGQFERVQKIMDSKKHIGSKGKYLCSGLVYCSCGAKMHVFKTNSKGHEYIRYCCSEHCGKHSVLLSDVDNSALKYLHELLSDANQERIIKALKEYQSDSTNRLTAFYDALNKRIADKQKEYDIMLKNLSNSVLPAEVIKDMGERMQALKSEISALKEATPPEDYTVDTIKQWLNALKNNPDEKAIKLLISSITVNTEKDNNSFNIQSTLNELLENMVAGEGLQAYLQLPAILFKYLIYA